MILYFLITIFIISPVYAHNGLKHTDVSRSSGEPLDIDYSPVAKIIERSCFNCHSTKHELVGFYTELPLIKSIFIERKNEALSHLDFSKGFPPRGHGNVRDDLVSIHRALAQREMPPQLWNWWHREHSLPDSDRARLMNWIEEQLNRLNP